MRGLGWPFRVHAVLAMSLGVVQARPGGAYPGDSPAHYAVSGASSAAYCAGLYGGGLGMVVL
jgi:hypothetical protein